MNWKCRLYGHQFRHPGTPEVRLTDDNGPVHEFMCEVCGARRVLPVGSREWGPEPVSRDELAKRDDDAATR